MPGEESGAAVSVGFRSGVRAGGVVGSIRINADRSAPDSRKSSRTSSAISLARVGAAGCDWSCWCWLISGCSPPAIPKVANYVQLTHDGQPKSLIGTDGARLYLNLGSGGAGSFASHGIAEMSVSGGEPKKISHPCLRADMVPVDLSPDGSELLVVDGQGAPPKGPLLEFPILGGSPRRLGDIVGETAAWSPDGKMLAYSNLGDLFVAKADGTEARKLLSVKGDIRNIAWSPGRQAICDSTPRRPREPSASNSRGKWRRTEPGSSLARGLARSARRVLRQVDGRRKVFCLPVERPDLGSSAEAAAFCAPNRNPFH